MLTGQMQRASMRRHLAGHVLFQIGQRDNLAFRHRCVFNMDTWTDGKTWGRKYRFESPHSLQYPMFHQHDGVIWLSVTQSDHKGSTDRIMFGKLENLERYGRDFPEHQNGEHAG